MLDLEKDFLEKNLEKKKHYTINNNNLSILFNTRIIKRYNDYYNNSTNIKYNLPLHDK